MARAATARSSGAPAAKRSTIRNPRERTPARRVAPPLEHRILMTAALCLLAFGAVMVYSASSPLGVIGGRGYGTGEFVRYLVFGALGLAGMHVLARRGMDLLNERMVRMLLIVSFSLLVLVMVPGFGVEVNGARRWFAAGPIQFQPSELMKLALVLYVARYLADHPKRMRGFRQAIAPVAVVVGPACLLIVVEPDLGTALVIAFAIAALLVAAGMPGRYLALLAAIGIAAVIILALAQPYERVRLETFLHPWAEATKAGPGLPGRAGADRARLGRPCRRRAGPLGPEDLLPARGPDGLHPRGDRRGARRAGDSRRRVPVRDDRLCGPAHRAAGRGALCEAAGHGTDLVDPLPGPAQHLRRTRVGAPDGRPAAVHLLRPDEPVHHARLGRSAAQHRAARGTTASRGR